MSIAAKLSRKLYDTLGSEAAEAMVDWMQQVETQRSELRELSDLSFARIDARFGEARAESDARFVEVLAQMDLRFARIDARFVEARAHTDVRLAELRDEMHTGFVMLEAKLDRRFAEVIKWSFVFWVGSTVTLVTALAALARFPR
jgi:hypothetical protein